MELVNAITGEKATPQVEAACKVRAIQILESPYSSPEQVEWAMGFVDDPVQYMLRPMQQKRQNTRKEA